MVEYINLDDIIVEQSFVIQARTFCSYQQNTLGDLINITLFNDVYRNSADHVADAEEG
jgi:hypothetical protein